MVWSQIMIHHWATISHIIFQDLRLLKSRFLTELRPLPQIGLKIPRGLWPYNYFSDILILRGQNHENITREIIAQILIASWGLRSAQIKKLKKTDPHFFQKNGGLFPTTFWSESLFGLKLRFVVTQLIYA